MVHKDLGTAETLTRIDPNIEVDNNAMESSRNNIEERNTFPRTGEPTICVL